MTTLFLNFNPATRLLRPAGDSDAVLLEHASGGSAAVTLEFWEGTVRAVVEAHGWGVEIANLPDETEPTKLNQRN